MSSIPKEYKDRIEQVNKNLKDIQSATVCYIYRQMYGEKRRRKMLVADEVGLGKTWVAKGLIARAFEDWYKKRTPAQRKQGFNVYYICSNQQLAMQNLRQINFMKKSECIANKVDRIAMLAKVPETKNTDFHVYSLTPDTSFNPRSTQGVKEERYIIFKLLATVAEWRPYRKRISDLMEGGWCSKKVHTIQWEPKEYNTEIREDVEKRFLKTLNEKKTKYDIENDFPHCSEVYGIRGKISFRALMDKILPRFKRKELVSSRENAKVFDELIGQLRKILIDSCLDTMNANLFIMDEFQRYSELLEKAVPGTLDETSEIAWKVFHPKNPKEESKVLMLSATPFKAYTNQHDEDLGEQHFAEFKRVFKFLYEGEENIWEEVEEKRKTANKLMKSIGKQDEATRKETIGKIVAINSELEKIYSEVMVRTEKIIASNDPDAMIRKSQSDYLATTTDDLKNFVRLDRIFLDRYSTTRGLAPAPLDYAKSAPYPMSFMRDYKIGKQVRDTKGALANEAFIDFNGINDYSFPENDRWPNSKFNLLLNGLEESSLLLWCPPSLPYYKAGGVYDGQEAFSKSLIFSAWKMVPVMIATLMSYEAEKYTIGKIPGCSYFVDRRAEKKGDAARKPYRLLKFDQNNRSTLLLAYPSLSLAGITDPINYCHSMPQANEIIRDTKEKLHWHFLREDAKTSLIVPQNLWSALVCQDSREKESWQWMSHCTSDGKSTHRNKQLMALQEALQEAEADEDRNGIAIDPKTKDTLARMALGSPAVCAYRSLARTFRDKGIGQETLLQAAFELGLAFIDLFNKPESIAIISNKYANCGDYWEKVVQYCIDGNLQAVLDEYFFMLESVWSIEKNEESNKEFRKMIAEVCDTIHLRTSSMKVDDAASIRKDEANSKRRGMRAHYAAAFGFNTKSSEGSSIRAGSIREAFNSPFRPFVLASTSIGQEGLDFHWYCRKIIHWNLPNNPIDFEQREGRINRFRGAVIRQRVAQEYANDNKLMKELASSGQNPWSRLFEVAATTKTQAHFPCDIVPNWIFNPTRKTDIGIQRIVPLFEFSQDIKRYEEMEKVLGLYKLAFGQPRQEELIKALDCNLSPDEIASMLINLCPMKMKV